MRLSPPEIIRKAYVFWQVQSNLINSLITRRLPSYRNQAIDLKSKSIDWFLYEDNSGV